MYTHIPVLLSEVITHLQPEPNKSFIDGTVGQGGHAEAILNVLPGGRQIRLLAIDRDKRNLDVAKERLARFNDAVVFVNDSFANIKQHALIHGFDQVDGILLDLGFSSAHVGDPERGFSFQSDGPLDMRYDRSQSLTAAKIVNEWDEAELARIFRQYGEEKQASKIAEVIVERRNMKLFERTLELAECVEGVAPRHGKIHPATRVFQALRIAVNDELSELQKALPDCVDLLKSGGRLAIISFHSLEDRMVKAFMKERDDLRVITKHVITASETEVKANQRARSAKLRVAEKI